jgi:hypothetical protein
MPCEEKTTMKHSKIKPNKPAMEEPAVAPLTMRPDPPLDRHVHTVTLHIGGRRYEMTLHSEFREITKGPARVIEMPRPSVRKE